MTCAPETPHQRHRRAFLTSGFQTTFSIPFAFNEMLHNKTGWRKQLANHPVMKAKDVNCLPALLHMTNLPSDLHLAGEETQRSSFQPLDFMLFSKKNVLWGLPRAHLVLPGVWGRTKRRSNRRTAETKPTPDLHIAVILLKLRCIFDLPRCRSFLHI